jgi:hypothetical protein
MGRRATGLSRKLLIALPCNQDEDEWVARESFSKGIAKAELLRRLVIPKDVTARLLALREKQRGLPTGEFRREPSNVR